VYRYYSLAHKLDESWFHAAQSLAQAAMNIFEANGHAKEDIGAINSYGVFYQSVYRHADVPVVPAIRGRSSMG
jgi:hypothetical protein